MRFFKIGVVCVAVLMLAETSRAAIIPGVTATSSKGTFSTYSLPNLTNGVGLTPSISETATHSSSFPEMWLNNAGGTTGSLTFDLGGTFSLGKIAIWQYNYILSRGIKDFTLESSTDGSTFSPLLGTTTLAIASGTPSETSQLFALGGTTASHVRLNYLNNYGDSTYTGLSEVQFVTSEVPEPGSILAMLSLAGCGVGAVVVRRRRAKKLAA